MSISNDDDNNTDDDDDYDFVDTNYYECHCSVCCPDCPLNDLFDE